MKTLEERLNDYKLIKKAIKRVNSGYKAVQLDNFGSEIDPASIGGGITIYSFAEELNDSNNIKHFIVRTHVDRFAFGHSELDYINDFIYHDFNEAMKECYKDIIKYSREFMHVTNGYVLDKGKAAVLLDNGTITFSYTTSLSKLFRDPRKEKMDIAREKRMVKMNPYLRPKKPIQEDESLYSTQPKEGIFRKIKNYISLSGKEGRADVGA